tara:strand:- start:304 stop:663 length:360 start_codon:yes stop_codon:yes gene_type:complete
MNKKCKVPGWNKLIIGTRKRKTWPNFVLNEQRLEGVISNLCKKDNNAGVKIHQAILNVISRSEKRLTKTNDTNEVRAYRLYGENIVRGLSYLMTFEDPKKILPMKCLKTGANLKKNETK